MQLDSLYRAFKTFKAVAELAYLLGFWIGKKRKKP